MGEAKRRENLGLTRRIFLENYELTDLIVFLVGDPNRPAANPKKMDRDKRRALRSALDQFGILDLWRDARRGGGAIRPELMPAAKTREVSVDAINTLLTHLKDEMDARDMMNIGEIEDRLEDAKDGLYEPPPDPPAPAPALEAVPEPPPAAEPAAT